MSLIFPIMIIGSGGALFGACLGFRGCIAACVFAGLSAAVGLWVIA